MTDDYLLKRTINKKKTLKDRFLKGHIFQELTLDEKLKGKDIKTKVKNIKDEEIYDLQLMDIHFLQNNLFLSPNLKFPKTSPLNKNKSFKQNTIIKHHLLINKPENNKTKLKIFPYISLPKNIKNKSSEIISLTENNNENHLKKDNFNDNKGKHILKLNDNENKLFMTKVDNKKNFKNNCKTYSHNLYDNALKNDYKTEDINKIEKGHYFNQSLINKKNKYLKHNNVLNTSKYFSKNNNISEEKGQNTFRINNIQYNSFSKENTIHYKNPNKDIEEKDDKSIYKLMKQNKVLRKFMKEKKRRRLFNYSLNNINRNRNSFNKQALNKRVFNNTLNINDYPTPNKNNNFNQIYYDNNQKYERIKSLNINTEKKINIYNNLNPKINININLNNNINEDNQLNYKKLLKDIQIKTNLLKNIKHKEKLKRYLFTLIINNLEEDLNKNYEDINNKFKNQKIKVENMKKKCINILKELDAKINFNLEEFIKEYEREDLGIKFIQFFNYLLMLLANYDKSIIPNTFAIKKATKNQLEVVKYSNVKKKHNEFMNLLDKQFNEGKNVNNLLKKYLLKRKEEVEKNKIII